MADNDIYSDFTWGKSKASSNKEKKFYSSFFYDNEEFSLHDNVMVYDEAEPDGHVAKIMKLWEDVANGSMMALLRWYLRPCELPSHLQRQVASENSKELFLAFGKGRGVSNENKLDLMKSVLEGCSDIQMLQRSNSLCEAFGEALLEFESEALADAALQQLEQNCLVIAGCTRPLIARKIVFSDPGTIARYPGHFPLDNFKLWKQRQEEVMRKSFETFHFADPNSIEFEMASEWRNLHEWLAKCWEQLCKAHGEETNMVTEKYKKPKLRVS